MKRLRHPIRAISEPFGKAGLIVAMIALVFAMAGGALAAKGALTGTQKKEVEKIAKKYAGKPGATGATGPAGPAGAAGKDGAPGAKGENGTNGTAGTSGANGKNVVVATANPEPAHCIEGGATVEVQGEASTKKYVCNGEEGEKGEKGETGSPWPVGGTLPKAATEKGAWAATLVESAAIGGLLGTGTASFAVPLPSVPSFAIVNPEGKELFYEETEPEEFEFTSPRTPAHCLGGGEAPTAPEGFLCVYAIREPPNVAPRAGVVLTSAGAGFSWVSSEAANKGTPIVGTWAATSAG